MTRYTDESVRTAVEELNKRYESRLKVFSDFIKAGFDIKIPLLFGVKEALGELFLISVSANLVYTAAEIYDFCLSEQRKGVWVDNIYNFTDLHVLGLRKLPMVSSMFVELREELARIENQGEIAEPFHFCDYFLNRILPKYALRHSKARGKHKDYRMLCLSLIQGEDVTAFILSMNLKYDRRDE